MYLLLFTDNREEIKGDITGQFAGISTGRSVAVSVRQQHTTALCAQHPCPFPCRGKQEFLLLSLNVMQKRDITLIKVKK